MCLVTALGIHCTELSTRVRVRDRQMDREEMKGIRILLGLREGDGHTWMGLACQSLPPGLLEELGGGISRDREAREEADFPHPFFMKFPPGGPLPSSLSLV